MAWADTGEGAAAKDDGARNKAAGNVGGAVDFQRYGEHREADHKARNTAIGQDSHRQDNRQGRLLFTQRADDQPGDGLCPLGYLVYGPHQRARQENQEVVLDKRGEPGHVVYCQRVI